MLAAQRGNFLLQKGNDLNSAVIALRDSLDGPQHVELQLVLRLSRGGVFTSKFLVHLHVFVSSQRRHLPHYFLPL